MASIRKDINLECSPEHVWAAVRDVGAVHHRFARGFVVDTKLEPGSRVVTFAGGAVARELIISFDDCSAWLDAAFTELHAGLGRAAVAGPDGALYPDEFFEVGEGRVVAFVPVTEPAAAPGRAAPRDLPAGELAVMVHTGPFSDLDQTYGALGTAVAERGIGRDGPIREHYLDDDRAEVCWPVDLSRR